MAQGTIRSIRDDRGFGFIRPDGGTEDLFFHSSAVADQGFTRLREGVRGRR
jgi:CspA family cold shock protein